MNGGGDCMSQTETPCSTNKDLHTFAISLRKKEGGEGGILEMVKLKDNQQSFSSSRGKI